MQEWLNYKEQNIIVKTIICGHKIVFQIMFQIMRNVRDRIIKQKQF